MDTKYRYVTQDADGWIKGWVSDDFTIEEGKYYCGNWDRIRSGNGKINSAICINLETHDYKIENGILMKVEKQNTKRHKHADLIHAFAEGAEIQYRDIDGAWQMASNPTWTLYTEYRIKPKTKTIRFRNWMDINGQIFAIRNDEIANQFIFKQWIGDWQQVEIEVSE